MTMNRRGFLRTAGTFVASAAMLRVFPACGDGDGSSSGAFTFPQGVASGDPRPTSVVLWTRVQGKAGDSGPIPIGVDVSKDMAFTTIAVSKMIEATAASDHTVRVIVTDLTPGTIYYYRFTAGSDTISGRTLTAPSADADVDVNFAWVSCQDYESGTHMSWKQMVADDLAAAKPIQFVVHLGDFIYETRGEGYQDAIDTNFQLTTVTNADGSPRKVPPFPSGPQSSAQTLADYRHLYKTYLTDPNLQAARARWPFVQTWDDHEFTDDCWQSQANYDEATSLDEPSQKRKVAANQAWFEFIPSHLSGAGGVTGVTSQAKDFAAPASLADAPFTAPDDTNFVTEPNNVAAVGSMTIYRSFRFGKHCELMLCDGRSYRSDHALPEELTFGRVQFFVPRNVLPINMVNAFDAGKTDNNGSPRATVDGFPNPRTTSPPGTMLGATQRAWLKDSLKNSDATWKLWGNPVMAMRVLIKKEGLPLLIFDRLMNADGWDGYNTERKDILGHIKSQGIKNVVSISGDIHAHFAGLLHDDYDGANPTVVGTEVVAAGISTNSLFSFFEAQARTGTAALLRPVLTFEKGNDKFVENMNLLILKGTAAALKFAETGDLQMGLAATDPTANAHLKYADCNSQGYGLMSVTATAATATLVTMNRPINNTAQIMRTAKFTIPKDNPAGMTGPELTGTKPIPFT